MVEEKYQNKTDLISEEEDDNKSEILRITEELERKYRINNIFRFTILVI